jgi:DNA-binding transcriptional LysR family regulator
MTGIPDLSEINALMAVLEQKSFTRAAEQLGLSPARVSEMIRNLEERLGVRLVERTTRSVAASPAGERLLQRLRPLLDDYREAIESLNDFRSKPAGTLRLTVAPPAADFVLAPTIARFVSRYPEISLDVSVDRAYVDIVESRFDAGIRTGERVARDMIAVRISDEMPFVVTGSPQYFERHGVPATPQDVTRHACIRFRLPSGMEVPWRFAKKQRTFDVRVEGPLVVNEPGLGIKAAIDGAGLLQLPEAYVAAELAAGRLVAILPGWEQPKIDAFFVYYPSRRQMRPPLKVLVDFLREAYRPRRAQSRSSAVDERSLASSDLELRKAMATQAQKDECNHEQHRKIDHNAKL